MTRTERLSDDHVRRLAEATAWRVSLSEADQLTNGAFEEWLASELENEIAWDEVQSSWGIFGDHASSPELLALRRAALGSAERRSARRWSQSAWLYRIAACLILMVGFGAAYFASRPISVAPHAQPLVYATAMGERRVIPLVDGSKLSLDSGTEVRVDYSPDARRLELLKGQARFDVAHDVTRPFTVLARDRMVVATGTAFTVDLDGAKVHVTLIEGKVLILPGRSGARSPPASSRPAQSISLVAGQQFTASPASPVKIEPVNLDRATSWESGQLVFEDERLDSIVERVSRYSPTALRTDPSVASLRISGVFNTGDVPTFVDTVERYLPVKGRRQNDGSILLTRSTRG